MRRPDPAAAFAVLVAATALATASAARGSPPVPNLEYAVKATYLYKFAPFVEWSRATFASATSPMVLCVAGADPFGPVLDRAVAGRKLGARPIVVRRFDVVSKGDGCQILYLSQSRAQSVADGLQVVRGQPVLTVTDAANPGSAKGVIHFVIVGNRVRFEIDSAAAAVNGLTISSKLLSLAMPGPRR